MDFVFGDTRMRERILKAIYASIDEINCRLVEDGRLALSPDTALYGAEGQLDSLTLVSLIVSAEQRIEDEFGVSLTLADDHALARKNSPFRSVAALAEYIEERVGEEGT